MNSTTIEKFASIKGISYEEAFLVIAGTTADYTNYLATFETGVYTDTSVTYLSKNGSVLDN